MKDKQDIYDYLRKTLDLDDVITVFMLSDNYYKSAACLNEMGAVWLKQSSYYTFLLPEFEYKDIKGAINANVKGIKLDITNKRLNGDLTNFKKRIENVLMGVELFMLSNQLLHPYHVVPAVEFATAEMEMGHTLVTHTFMKTNAFMS